VGDVVAEAVDEIVGDPDEVEVTVDDLQPDEDGQPGAGEDGWVVEVTLDGSLNSAVTLATPFGPLIVYGNASARDGRHSERRCSLQVHERGHAMQYWRFFSDFWPSYYPTVGLPSVASYHGDGVHHDHPVEQDATDRGTDAYGSQVGRDP
jgi:hypothetical protein